MRIDKLQEKILNEIRTTLSHRELCDLCTFIDISSSGRKKEIQDKLKNFMKNKSYSYLSLIYNKIKEYTKPQSTDISATPEELFCDKCSQKILQQSNKYIINDDGSYVAVHRRRVDASRVRSVASQTTESLAQCASGGVSVNDVNQTEHIDSLHFHFNKPGFDLAIIITDSCLLPTIGNFQTAFQSMHGFTTHVIYVPDVSRVKNCITDLKLHEILYAIVVNDNSYQVDEYDVYVLTNTIKLQSGMCYAAAVELINNDFLNYSEKLRSILKEPEKCPHPDNTDTEGFICPSDKIRYLLCLLFDNRMLKLEELQTVRSFVQLRKEALRTVGTGRSINYRENERPIPPYWKDTLKYYVYEPKQSTI